MPRMRQISQIESASEHSPRAEGTEKVSEWLRHLFMSRGVCHGARAHGALSAVGDNASPAPKVLFAQGRCHVLKGSPLLLGLGIVLHSHVFL